VKELDLYDHHQSDGLSDQCASTVDVTELNDACYVNKGFNDSNSVNEELSNEVRLNFTLLLFVIIISYYLYKFNNYTFIVFIDMHFDSLIIGV